MLADPANNVIHHDQLEFIPGMQSWLNSQKSVIDITNRLKKKKPTQSSHQMQKQHMAKFNIYSQQTINKREHHNLIKGTYEKATIGEPNNFRGAYGYTGQLACRSPLKSSLQFFSGLPVSTLFQEGKRRVLEKKVKQLNVSQGGFQGFSAFVAAGNTSSLLTKVENNDVYLTRFIFECQYAAEWARQM